MFGKAINKNLINMKNKVVCFIFLLSFPFIGISQWISVPTGINQDFWVVDFINSQTGYCSGGYYKTFKTTDGGITWADVADQGFNDYSFFNETVGYATSSSVGVEIARTSDGGNSWTTLNPPSGQPRVETVKAISENTAYFAGNGGSLYKTTDGGTSFSILDSGLNEHINDIFFTNPTTGYLISFYNIKKTTDSGATWNTIYTTSGSLKRIYFVNENVGYVVGRRYIYKTTDAGNTWNVYETDFPNELQDIDFYDENHGFAVGGPSLILYTDNGGESWTLQDSGITQALNSVKMTSPTNAIVVGFNGTILRNFGTLGVDEEILSHNFALFPNPVINNLTITGKEELDSIQVFNILGKLLFENNKVFSEHYTIDFSAYSEGVYFINIGDVSGNLIVKKVIKN